MRAPSAVLRQYDTIDRPHPRVDPDLTEADSEKAALAPGWSPTVLADPIPACFVETDTADTVTTNVGATHIRVDAASIPPEVFVDGKHRHQRASVTEPGLHLIH